MHIQSEFLVVVDFHDRSLDTIFVCTGCCIIGLDSEMLAGIFFFSNCNQCFAGRVLADRIIIKNILNNGE